LETTPFTPFSTVSFVSLTLELLIAAFIFIPSLAHGRFSSRKFLQ